MTPCIEPIVLAQKPKEGTFVDNWLKWGVGLMNTNERMDGAFPKNLIYVDKSERRNDCDFKIEHLTPKPVKLISHLISFLLVRTKSCLTRSWVAGRMDRRHSSLVGILSALSWTRGILSCARGGCIAALDGIFPLVAVPVLKMGVVFSMDWKFFEKSFKKS